MPSELCILLVTDREFIQAGFQALATDLTEPVELIHRSMGTALLDDQETINRAMMVVIDSFDADRAFALAERIKAAQPKVPIVLLTSQLGTLTDDHLRRVYPAVFSSLIDIGVVSRQLSLLRQVIAGEPVWAGPVPKALISGGAAGRTPARAGAHLTEAEVSLLQALVTCKNLQEAARELGIGERTAYDRRLRLRARLQARSDCEMVLIARELGYL